MTQRKRFELAFKEFTVSIMPMAGKTAAYDEWRDIQELVAALGQTTEDTWPQGLSEDEVVLEVAQATEQLRGFGTLRAAAGDDGAAVADELWASLTATADDLQSLARR